MSRLSFIELDTSNLDAHLHEIAVLKTAVNAEIASDDPPVNLAWARSEVDFGTDLVRKRHVLAAQNGRALGIARIVLDMTGPNQHVADLHIEVHPAHRRAGIGTGLVASGAAIANSEGRTSLTPWGPRSETSDAFWNALSLPEVSIHQLSRLTVDDVQLAVVKQWHDQTAARQQGYTLRSWRGQCPAELMPMYVEAQHAMDDAPTDDLETGHTPFDDAWNRAREASYRRRGGLVRGIVALSPDGEAAGMTDLVLYKHRAWLVEQQGTATVAAHRNKGVARWLKATAFRELLRDHPEVNIIETGNGASNHAMLSINQQMGFRPHIDLTIRQGPLDAVTVALRHRLSGTTVRPAVVPEMDPTNRRRAPGIS